MPELPENETVVKLRMPVIWEPVRGAMMTQASSTPTTINIDQLRALIERSLRYGGYWELRAGELVDWASPDAGWLPSGDQRDVNRPSPPLPESKGLF
jgi:hypothetical protein